MVAPSPCYKAMADSENYPNAPYLTVADPKRSIRFYTKLGFELENCWPDARKPVYASLVLERQVVMLGISPSEKDGKAMGVPKPELRRIKKEHKAFKKHRHGVGVQMYLRVPDADAHHRLGVRKKLEVLRGPTTHFYGIRDWIAADPDGYQLVFFAPAEASAELAPAPRKAKKRVTRRKAPAAAPVGDPAASELS